MEVFLAHLRHALQVAGEEHVGFGTDGDPVQMDPDDLEWEIDLQQRAFERKVSEYPQLDWPIRHVRIPELDSPHRVLNLVRAMESAGYASRTIEKVIGGNYLRAFREAVG